MISWLNKNNWSPTDNIKLKLLNKRTQLLKGTIMPIVSNFRKFVSHSKE